MKAPSLRLVLVGFLVALCVAGCSVFSDPLLPSATLSSLSTPSVTLTPSVTPQMPDGPYPPVVVGYTPQSGQMVGVDTAIMLRFDQPMDRRSVSAALRIAPAIDGAVTWRDDTTAVFQPQALSPATRYRVSVGEGARSIEGVPLASELTFAFSTLSSLVVTQVSPTDVTDGVRIDAPVFVAFNHPVVPLHCVGQATDNADCPMLPLTFSPSVMGHGAWVNTSLYRYDVFRGWAAGEIYAVVLDAGVISVDGAVLSEPVEWTFKTASPVIVETFPDDGQQRVPIEASVRVVFNTPMDDEITGSVFSMAKLDGTMVSGAITWLDNAATLVFTPTDPLELGSQYVVNVGRRARAATSAPLQNPLDWTFTTVSYPSLVAFMPSDEATTVRIQEPVRVTFSGAIDPLTLEGRVVVSPSVANLYTYFDRETGVYSLSWDKTPRAEYCVTVKPGVGDVYGHRIETAQTACFVTGDLNSYLSPVTDLDAFTLNAAEVAELSFVVRNRTRAAFVLSELDAASFIRGWNAAGTSLRNWTETLDVPLNTATIVPVDLWRERSLPTGYYQLTWENPPWGTQSVRLGVVDHHVTLKLAVEEALVWVTDLQSGDPISRTAVQLVDGEGLVIAAGTTDNDGLARIPISPRDDLWESVAAIAGTPGLPGFGVALTHWGTEVVSEAANITLDPRAASPYTVFVYTDRSVYRPGQMVHFHGVVREDGQRYQMPALDVPVTVMLRNALNEEVYSATLALSAFGTFDDAIVLAENTPIGDYVLETVISDTGIAYTWDVNFAVADYHLPNFKVAVLPEYVDVLAGEGIRALVSADYDSGFPVSHARFQWAVLAQSENASPGEKEAASRQVVVEGEAETDAAGRFLLEIPASSLPARADGPSGTQVWTIEVIARDESDFPVYGQADVTVHPARFSIELTPQQRVVSAGTRAAIGVLASDWEQQPIAGQNITLTLVRRTWERMPDTYGATGLTWVYSDTTMLTVTVETDSAGLAEALVTPSQTGHYVVVAEAVDADGYPVHSETALWVSGSDVVRWPMEVGVVTPVADAQIYQVGDTARILVPTPLDGPSPLDGPYQMLITIERDGILSFERRIYEEANPIIEVPILQGYVPNVYVSFVLLGAASETTTSPDARTGYVILRVEPKTQTLTVEITPDKAAYGPGDRVELAIRAIDAAGHTVDAELGVAVVDKMATTLQDSRVASIFDAFYGEQPLRVVTGDSLLMQFDHVAQQFQSSAQGADFLIPDLSVPQNAPYREEAPLLPVREAFPDTVLWEARLRTGDARVAHVAFDLPDSLTTWAVDARAITLDSQVGEARVELGMLQPLVVLPVTPRFFVAGDEPEVAAVIYNNTETALDVTARLHIEAGGALVGPEGQSLTIPPHTIARVAWTMIIAETNAENVSLVFSVAGGGYEDVAHPTADGLSSAGLPLYRYVSRDIVGTAGMLSGVDRHMESMIFPPDAGDASALVVNVDPSSLSAAVSNLQYLEQYPYASADILAGQFLSAVAIQSTLEALNIADRDLSAQLRTSMTGALERLYALQNTDGGWGWWLDQSHLYQSAYVAFGMVRASQAGFEVRQDVLARALTYVHDTLAVELQQEGRFLRHALALYVLTEADVSWPTGAGSDLYAARASLGMMGQAYLALAYGTTDAADPRLLGLLDGLRGAAVVTASGAHWESAESVSWNTDVVATAVMLDILARFVPDDPLLPQATHWLLMARRAGRWSTPCEAAWGIIGLTDAARVSGDFDVDYSWHVMLNGGLLVDAVAEAQTRAAAWSTSIGVPSLLRTRNVLEIAREAGPGQLYYTAHMEVSSPVEQVKAQQRGFVVYREYCVVVDSERSNSDSCVPVDDIRVGDMIDVRLTLIVPQKRYYVVLKDPYPAGMEPVNSTVSHESVRSPFPVAVWWRSLFDHREFRDGHVAFFAQEIPAGTYQVTYRLRAVTPGVYKVLPAVVTEVYFPEVWGQTDGRSVVVLPAAP